MEKVEQKTEYYTKTHHHHNPGGYQGSTGSRGRLPTKNLYSKPAGKDARLNINITNNDGTITTYKNGRYDLQIIQHAEFKSATSLNGILDGTIEPGEYMEVTYKVRNTTDMPTPNRVAHLAVLDSQGVRTTDVTRRVEIPSLKPGEVYTTKPVFVKAHSLVRLPVIGDAKVEKGSLTPKTTQSGTGPKGSEKVYKRATNTTEFDIKQAVKLDNQVDIKGTTSIVPGKEQSIIEIKVYNNSQKNGIGSETKIPRQVSTRQQFIEIDGIHPDNIIAYNEAGNEISLADAITTEHKNIPPGESKTIKLKIGIREGTKPYTSGRLETTLNRGALEDLLGSEDIQVQKVKFQAVKVFDPKVKPDIILVTNSNTSKKALQTYKEQMLKNYGKVVEDYNISYYSAFDLEKPPLNQLDNKKTTVMILNNEFGPEASKAASRLKLNQIYEGVQSKGMNVMFLGPDDPSLNIANRLFPTTIPSDQLDIQKL